MLFKILLLLLFITFIQCEFIEKQKYVNISSQLKHFEESNINYYFKKYESLLTQRQYGGYTRCHCMDLTKMPLIDSHITASAIFDIQYNFGQILENMLSTIPNFTNTSQFLLKMK